MTRSLLRPAQWAAALITIATATTAVVAAAEPAAQPRNNTNIKLIAAASTNSSLYVPCSTCVEYAKPAGAHLGGTEVDSGVLTNPMGKPVGHYGLVSVGVTPFGPGGPGEVQQHESLVIGDSQLTAESLEEPPLNGGTAAITGGTGRYRGARGQINYTDNADGSTNLTIILDH